MSRRASAGADFFYPPHKGEGKERLRRASARRRKYDPQRLAAGVDSSPVSARSPSAMARVMFTANIQRHVVCPDAEAFGRSVREVLDGVLAKNPQARSYVL